MNEDIEALRRDAARWRHVRDHAHISFDEPVLFSIGTADGKAIEIESQFPAHGTESDNAVDADIKRIEPK